MAKVLLKLHQPHKWKKHKYITDDDYAKAEHRIYNNLSMKTYLEEIMPEADDNWLNDIMVEDEAFDYLEGEKSNYVITTYGRVINTDRKKKVQPSLIGNNFFIFVKGTSVSFKHEFNRIGWIFSPSFIIGKYDEYKWPYYQNYKAKK